MTAWEPVTALFVTPLFLVSGAFGYEPIDLVRFAGLVAFALSCGGSPCAA
jgi:hypothetical protein